MPEADFTAWDRKTLEQFARLAADDNHELRADLRAALDAYRALVREQSQETVCQTPT